MLDPPRDVGEPRPSNARTDRPGADPPRRGAREQDRAEAAQDLAGHGDPAYVVRSTGCGPLAMPRATSSKGLGTPSSSSPTSSHFPRGWSPPRPRRRVRQVPSRGRVINGRPTRVLAEQTAAVDPSRLGAGAGHLTFEELRHVSSALRLLLALQLTAQADRAGHPASRDLRLCCQAAAGAALCERDESRTPFGARSEPAAEGARSSGARVVVVRWNGGTASRSRPCRPGALADPGWGGAGSCARRSLGDQLQDRLGGDRPVLLPADGRRRGARTLARRHVPPR